MPLADAPEVYRSLSVGDGDIAWTLLQRPQNLGLIPEEERLDPKCKHLDYCSGMSNIGGATQPVVYQLPAMVVGMVWLCLMDGTDSVAAVRASNKTRIMLDGEEIPSVSWDFQPDKCLVVQHSWGDRRGLEEGAHMLGFYTDINVAITHVIVQ